MRLRARAAFTATLIAAAALIPQVAFAASGSTLYVSGSNTACSDTGGGTESVPYCTIQAAANVVNPGDVIEVEAGTYAPATFTRSGTATEPITITGELPGAEVTGGSTAASDLTLSDVSYVRVEKLTLGQSTSTEIAVNGGSQDTISNVAFVGSTAAPEALHITGGASAVTVVDSFINRPVLVDGASTGTILTTNEVGAPLEVTGATHTAITSNTFDVCGSAISVTNSSTTASIENNNIANVASAAVDTNCPAQTYGIQVDPSSVAGTTSDYNDVNASSGTADYNWNGSAYATQADFTSATAQGAHDVDGPGAITLTEKSPLINSANSDAIGEQTTDILGNSRYLDPLVTPTGAGTYDYYDRGAHQFQDPLALVSPSFTVQYAEVPVGTALKISASTSDTWGDTDLTYAYTISPAAYATLTQPSPSSGNAMVTFSRSDAFTISLYVQSPRTGTFERYVGTRTVQAASVVPLRSSFTVARLIRTDVQVADISTDDWTVTGVSWNFGDGTGAIAGTPCCGASDYTHHSYAKPGTYQITETVTDQVGNTATSTQSFTTMEVPANSLVTYTEVPVVVPEGPGVSPPTASGVTRSGVAVMPDGDVQYVAVTTGGVLEHDIHFANGTWQGWRTLSQPGVTVTGVGIAGMPNGSAQIVEVLSNGAIRHDIRNANGSWQSTGWGSLGTNFAQVAITKMPDGSAQLVAVTTGGVLEHDIRFASGSWQGWHALTQPGVTVIDASIAGLADGSSQIAEVTSTGVMEHDVRYANGSWQKIGWGSPAGSTGLSRVSIAAMGNGTMILATTPTGGLEEEVRFNNGRWAAWQTTDETVTGPIADPALSVMSAGQIVVSVVSAGN